MTADRREPGGEADAIVVRAADPADHPAVLALMTEYMTWAMATFAETYGWSLPGDPVHRGDALVAFTAPRGLLLVAEAPDGLAGVAAARWSGETALEVKRMYVRPSHRSAGVGACLVDQVLEEARRRGAERVRLDTNRFMHAAQRLYESRGFRRRPPYEGSEIPPELHHLWWFYERTTDPAG